MNQGKGIFLVKNLEQLRTELDERYNSAFSTHRSTRIISRYVSGLKLFASLCCLFIPDESTKRPVFAQYYSLKIYAVVLKYDLFQC